MGLIVTFMVVISGKCYLDFCVKLVQDYFGSVIEGTSLLGFRGMLLEDLGNLVYIP